MGQSQRILDWRCYHTTDITRCAQCGLIFCGICQRGLLLHKMPHRLEVVTACPHCRGTVLIDLSPETPPTNAIRRPNIAPLGTVPAA